MSELRSEQFRDAHPVIQAAYAHYAFVCIHPFSDGNGRVSRAFASVFLYRSPGMPLVIFADQKQGYVAALEAADGGNLASFLRYIADRVMDAALRLEEEWAKAIDEAMTEEPVAAPYTAQRVNMIGAARTPGSGYRLPLHPNGAGSTVGLSLQSPPPMQANVNNSYFAEIAKPEEHDLPDIAIVTGSRSVVEIKIGEAYPLVSTALTVRMKAVALAEWRRAFSEAVDQGTTWLRTAGYSGSATEV
jgi:hypothetical protein